MRKFFVLMMLFAMLFPTTVRAEEKNSERDTTFVTKSRFMPTRKRVDREINKNVFAYKGELTIGLTASYGTLSSDNSDIFAILENINASGSVTTISPYVGYFIADNMSVGVRLGYTNMGGKLDNMDLNLGSQNDVGITIPWIDLSSNTFRVSTFMRNYASIDQAGRFGVFSELEVSYAAGENSFGFRTGDDGATTYSDSESKTVKLWFNPGLAVYMFPNVCATISFGMGGFKYTSVKQYDELGVQTGQRSLSKLRFRLNLADINFGLNIHLWSKHKH